ncbi:Mediator of RNA polymerase II transcription subunit 24, partial [Biomphalaria glabrata]
RPKLEADLKSPVKIELQSSELVYSTNMVVAPEKVAETVAVVPRPGYEETSVFSLLEVSDHRRHKEEVTFQPVLHPVRYADTAYVYLNSTKKRFVSRTFYEARIRPRSFSDTTYTFPKTADHFYVSYLDVHNHENRKWYKTSVEVKARKFTTEHILRPPGSTRTDFLTKTVVHSSTHPSQRGSGLGLDHIPSGASFNTSNEVYVNGAKFQEEYDPGASQIYIPKSLKRSLGEHSLLNGDIKLQFGKKTLDFNMNDPLLDFSDV